MERQIARGYRDPLDVFAHLNYLSFFALSTHGGKMAEEQNDDLFARYPAIPAPDATPEDRARWMESQLELYTLALDAIHDGVVVTDHVGGITYVNPAAAAGLFFRSAREMIGERIFHWFEDVSGEESIAAKMDRGETVRNRRVFIRRSNGARVSALLSVTPMMSRGRMVRVIGLFRSFDVFQITPCQSPFYFSAV